MKIQEYAQVLEFVQTNHKFALWLPPEEEAARAKEFPKLDKYGFNIKYVDSVYDSRDAAIWLVTFRSGNYSVNMRDSATPEEFESHFAWCMAYLKGEWEPTKEFVTTL